MKDKKADELAKTGWMIRCKRKEKRITQRDLATKADVPFHHLARIERGETLPGKATLQLLAKALKVPYRDLLHGR